MERDPYHLVNVESNVAFLSPAVFEVFQLPSQVSSVQQPGVQEAAMAMFMLTKRLIN